MPNCFQLRRKGEKQPEFLQRVDEELCEMLQVDVHPKCWVENWYNTIGFIIAVKGFNLGNPALREELTKNWELADRPALVKCLDYLETHFDSDDWVEIGKR